MQGLAKLMQEESLNPSTPAWACACGCHGDQTANARRLGGRAVVVAKLGMAIAAAALRTVLAFLLGNCMVIMCPSSFVGHCILVARGTGAE